MTRNHRKWAVTWLLALLLLASGCDPCINCTPSAADNALLSQAVPMPTGEDESVSVAPTHFPRPQPTSTPTATATAASSVTAAVAGVISPSIDTSASTDLLPEKIVDPSQMEKRIVVDISEQRVYAYENNRIVNFFQASTGRNQNTAIGSFKILDKKLRPYSEPWDFWMPHWMGIYWVAGLKNGFHAPPVLENGQVLWADQIGTPATNGCIMLLPEDMEKLYHWSEVGMPVEIVE